MRTQHFAVALVGTALLTLPAFAQTSPSTGTQPGASSGNMNQSGSNANQPATSGQSGAASQSGTASQPAASQSGTMNQSGSMNQTGTANQSATATGQSGNIQFLNQSQAGQWRASKLMGVDVYGPNNEKVGDINEVLIDRSGNVQAVVIGVGGFLGIGEKDVAIPFDSLQWGSQPNTTAARGTADRANNTTGTAGADRTATTGTVAQNQDAPERAQISLTKEQLQNAPSFKYASDQDRGAANTPANQPARGTGTAR